MQAGGGDLHVVELSELHDLLREMLRAGPGAHEIAARLNVPYDTFQAEVSRVADPPGDAGEWRGHKLGLVRAIEILDCAGVNPFPLLEWLVLRYGYLIVRPPNLERFEGQSPETVKDPALIELGQLAERLRTARAHGLIDEAEEIDLYARMMHLIATAYSGAQLVRAEGASRAAAAGAGRAREETLKAAGSREARERVKETRKAEKGEWTRTR